MLCRRGEECPTRCEGMENVSDGIRVLGAGQQWWGGNEKSNGSACAAALLYFFEVPTFRAGAAVFSRKPFLARRGTSFRYFMRPVPSVRRRLAFSPQLSEGTAAKTDGEPAAPGSHRRNEAAMQRSKCERSSIQTRRQQRRSGAAMATTSSGAAANRDGAANRNNPRQAFVSARSRRALRSLCIPSFYLSASCCVVVPLTSSHLLRGECARRASRLLNVEGSTTASHAQGVRVLVAATERKGSLGLHTRHRATHRHTQRTSDDALLSRRASSRRSCSTSSAEHQGSEATDVR